MLLGSFFKRLANGGTIRLIDSRGREASYGDGGPPRCTLRVHSRRLEFTPPINPPLYFSEAYMDGLITIEDGCLEDFLSIVSRNHEHVDGHWLLRLRRGLIHRTRWLNLCNPIRRARRNVAHHYDLSGALYDLFLDRDRQYSCAYFRSPADSLEQAQEHKKCHIAAKLLLDRPGLKVLDIGSGWGGLGLHLAENSDCDVTGLTLSVEQHKVSQARAKHAGLGGQVKFLLRDYREDQGTYDRIVSVGMFEHVGKRNYDDFFRRVRDLLADDGVCLLHTIGRFKTLGAINPFIRKYIFPGGEVPTLSEIMSAVEKAGLLVTDAEVLRGHYAETLKIWHRRFQTNRTKVAEIYDERFCRMWELYLKGCEMGFRHEGLTVFQVQLAKRQEAVPGTRDYIFEWERRFRRRHARAAA